MSELIVASGQKRLEIANQLESETRKRKLLKSINSSLAVSDSTPSNSSSIVSLVASVFSVVFNIVKFQFLQMKNKSANPKFDYSKVGSACKRA